MNDTKPTIDYPNIVALSQGLMSGSFSEYPQLRVEAEKILAELKRIHSAEMPVEPEIIKHARELSQLGSGHNKTVVAYIDALKDRAFHMADENAKLKAENEANRKDAERMLIATAHYHVQSHDGNDTCKECGLNLRDKIHFPKYIDMRRAAIDAALAKGV